MRERGAELPHVADRALHPVEREIERMGHFVELVAGAPDRQPPLKVWMSMGRVASPGATAAPARGPPSNGPTTPRQQAGDDAPEQQPSKLAIDGRCDRGHPDLEQELVAVGAVTTLLEMRSRPRSVWTS